jgi:glycosyltransferase involved in cell wall biosynthesis
MDKANAALAEYLIDREAPVHLVGHAFDPGLAARPGVSVYRARKPAASNLLGEFCLDRRARAVAAEVRRKSGDARIVVNGGNCAWPDINWIHCVHHAWEPCDRDAPAWFRAKNRIAKVLARRREARALRLAQVIVANSDGARSDLLKYFDLDPRRIHTAYLAADSDWSPATPLERARARAWLGKGEDRPLVAFVGALGHDCNKGFDTLWRAWSILCARPAWDVDLIVAGGGLGSSRWQARVAGSPLAGRAIMLGFTDRVKDVLAAADVLASPARYEAYGLNVQEAICRGVPALVSACAGIAERYPKDLQDLLIPDPEDANDLAARLVRWRSDITTWKHRVAPFARELRMHTWRRMAEQIVSIAEDAAQQSATSVIAPADSSSPAFPVRENAAPPARMRGRGSDKPRLPDGSRAIG